MKLKDIKKVGVVGAGSMGAGIAQLFAVRGFKVVMYDVEEEALVKARFRIEKSLLKMVAEGKLTEEQKKEIRSARIATTSSLKDFSEMDFVIEAAPEDLKLKKYIFTQLNTIVKPEVILATNTSSLSLLEIATASGRPMKVVGMHFMNPPTIMELVEVVKSPATDLEAVELVKDLAKKLGKTPVVVPDSPGFVLNRLIVPVINNAIKLKEKEGMAEEDIDTIVEKGAHHPMGPFKLADLVGLDVVLVIMKELYQRTGDESYRPATLLEKKVALRELGKKTGKGFYEYGEKK